MANSRSGSVPIRTASPLTPRREYWRALVEECGRSGVSQAEFCRRRGIAIGTLSFWKHTLNREAGPGAPRVAAVSVTPAFVPVRLATPVPSGEAPPAGAPFWDGELEIVLDRGRLVRVRGRVDPQWLEQVLGTLEARRC
jgi:hypothetical protein